MGKRKRNKDGDEDYEYLAYKIKKLERQLKRGRRSPRHEYNSEHSVSSEHSPSNTEDGVLPFETNTSGVDDELINENSVRSTVHVPLPSTSSVEPAIPQPLPQAQPPPQTQPLPPEEQEPIEPLAPVTELDSTILEIFGDDPSVVKQYGKEIQADLAVRLQHIATNGLSKETSKELCEKYLPPSNCTLIDAPELNPEIKAAVSEAVIKRDKGLQLKQRQVGRAITCIGEAISTLISTENKDTAVVKLLMDASRLLCDNQNLNSVTRRNFILFSIKKEMKDQIQKTKIDKLLFGADLAETLKTAKAITKSGTDLKTLAPPNNKPTFPKNKTPLQQATTLPQRNNLNWKAPPQNRRPQGSQRGRGPAPRTQHASSSGTSYRAHQHRNNSRR